MATTTWADAYGTWHARVTDDQSPRAAAQLAIYHEIAARQAVPADTFPYMGAPAYFPMVEEVEPGHFVEVEPS